MQKATVILGSPRRHGNSEILANKAMDGIRTAGGACEVFRLNAMKIRPCQACEYCRNKGNGQCAVRDDMDQIYAALSESDVLLLACPIYMFTVTAQLKLFMDRCYACPGALAGKRVGILLTYGDTDEHTSGAINAIHTFRDEYRYAHADIVGIVHGSANEKGEINKDKKVLEEAFILGKNLFLNMP
mgnify:CR=1 FL=1